MHRYIVGCHVVFIYVMLAGPNFFYDCTTWSVVASSGKGMKYICVETLGS